MVGNFSDVVLIEDLIRSVSSLTTLFQAIGGLILAYILFNIINLIIQRKRKKELIKIRELLERIDKKLEKGNRK